MTFVQHGTIAGILTHYAGCPWEVCVVVGVIGTLPDVLPALGMVNGEYDTLYARYHKWDNNWLAYLLPSALHILIDKFWHKPTGGWYWWGVMAETYIWIGEIFLVWKCW
jgi:hypothetical protein